ncbi:MAG: hypothetical protein R3C19_01590 [Planctomycetaceae bacterium]
MMRIRNDQWPVLLCLSLLACCVCEVEGAESKEVSVIVSIGGAERAVGGQWAMIKADVANKSDTDQEATIVVTPRGSSGLQYARRVHVPAGVVRQCHWPVFTWPTDEKMLQFDYVVLQGSDNQNLVQRRMAEEVVRTVSVGNSAINPASGGGYCGWLSTDTESLRERPIVEHLNVLMREAAGTPGMQVLLNPDKIQGYPEAFDLLSQLVISASDLHHFPEACDATRVWIQRGGKVLIHVDQTGPEVVSALLGDAFPLTVIDATTTNTIDLVINPDSLKTRYPVREVHREFEEPVRLLRTMIETGYVHWSMDGWPVLVQLPLGRGQVLLSFMSPEIYIEDQLNSAGQPVGSRITTYSEQIREAVFVQPEAPPLVSREVLSKVAADRVGYSVPTAGFAASVMFGFTLALLGVGLVAFRREKAAVMLWLVPVLAIAAAVPAMMAGSASRNVAGETAIRQDVIFVAPGQTTLAMDGVASVYCPEPSTLDIRLTDYALMNPPEEESGGEIHRLVWTERGVSEWQNLTQPTGIRNYRTQSLLRLDQPSQAVATFDANGLTGKLNTASTFSPEDAVVAGLSPDRMAVTFDDDGTFHSTPADVLSSQQFSITTLLSDDQLSRASVYSEVFNDDPRTEVFPNELSLLYWSDSLPSTMSLAAGEMGQQASSLLVQPLKLTSPPVNTRITIPPTMLPYRAVLDKYGGIGSAFSNRNRVWNASEGSANLLLEFSIPQVCQPFQSDFARLDLRIRAGLRKVDVSCGTRETLQLVQTLDSPVGLFTLELPVDLLREAEQGGHVLIKLSVGDAEVVNSDGVSEGERDDTWKIERLMLTLQGQRIE